MSRVITFSTHFPKGHRDAGKPTNFVEKIYSGLLSMKFDLNAYCEDVSVCKSFKPKFHTIRAGKRWKEGDMFSPRIWTDKPYNSKQSQFAPDLEIVKVYDFAIQQYRFLINGKTFYWQHKSEWHEHMETLCQNDGLSFGQLLDWFKVPCEFDGQIICWNNGIEY